MARMRETVAADLDGEILAEVRALAEREGRNLQALIDEALADLLQKKQLTQPRRHVIAAHQESHERFSSLYEKLAK